MVPFGLSMDLLGLCKYIPKIDVSIINKYADALLKRHTQIYLQRHWWTFSSELNKEGVIFSLLRSQIGFFNNGMHSVNVQKRAYFLRNLTIFLDGFWHGLRTPNESTNQRNLKFWADVADKICFGRTYKFGIGSWFSAVQWRRFPHRASVVRDTYYASVPLLCLEELSIT